VPITVAQQISTDSQEVTPAVAEKGPAAEPEKKESFWSRLHDPQDGAFDMSRYLLEHKGALVVPIIVTEPAVGNGFGLAPIFFRQPKQSDASKARGERLPPNIFAAMAFKTANGSYAYGAGGMFHFKDDTWRYAGVVGKGSFNLDYYPQLPLLAPYKIGYNTNGLYSLQQVSRRLGLSKWMASVRWVYVDVNSRLNIDGNKQYFQPKEFASVSSGLGLKVEYDSRNNTLSPTAGTKSTFIGTFFSPTFGSDNTYQDYQAQNLAYIPLNDAWMLGTRVSYESVSGTVPFYRQPFVDLRGITRGRFQDRNTAVLEAELDWNFNSRWTALAFGGAGRAWGRKVSFGDSDTAFTKGLGFRYLIARALGLRVGLDWAWGPGEHAFYIQTGSAWR